MKRINLISGPRNVSTALMYSFAQRRDTSVIDEPFYAHYLSITDVDHPGMEEVMQAQSSDPEKVIRRVILDSCQTPVLFIKNMAHHLEEVNWSFLDHTSNVFLIRNPEEMLTSFLKKIKEPTLNDTAYKQQVELFDYITQSLNQDPIVIDSRELLLDPEQVLEQVCLELNIPFDTRMLKWEPGPIEEDGVWAKYWYENVHRSTGFKPYTAKEEKVPEQFSGLLEKCKTYYNRLYKHAIKVE